MEEMFNDPVISAEFEENGYFILPSFIPAVAIKELSELFDSIKPAYPLKKIYSNLEDNDKSINVGIEKKIEDLFHSSLQKYFRNYKIYGGSFLIKGIGEDSVCSLHQDWNTVDESENVSFCVWIPLEDVDENNGCLQVLPGSHQWFSSIRSVNILSHYVHFDERVKDRVVSLPVKAGTAVVFAVNLFHGSKPNTSDHVRKAAHLVLVNQSAELIHYVGVPGEKKILKVACTPDLLYDFIFNIKKGIMPADMKVLDEFIDDDSFLVDEARFWQKFEDVLAAQ